MRTSTGDTSDLTSSLGSPSLAQGFLLFPEHNQILVEGSIERIPYFDIETGKAVLEIKPEGAKTTLFLSCRTPPLYAGLALRARVSLNEAQKDALAQNIPLRAPVPAADVEWRPPAGERQLKKFLKSGALPGLGTQLARLLSRAFPKDLFAVLNESPERLREIRGVGPRKHEKIIENWDTFQFLTGLEKFMFEQALPLNWAKILWADHGTDSLNYFKKYPYQTVRDYGFSFIHVDTFALKFGASPDSAERARCALYDALKNDFRSGHCATPESKLIEMMERLSLPAEVIERALEAELIEETCVTDEISHTPCIYLKDLWDLERDVARKLLGFTQKQPPWGWFHLEKVLTWAQSLLSIRLAPLQVEAIETALSSSLTLITGGPGTGKTTLIRSLVAILQTQHCKLALCSPTGRGAQRLEEATAAPAQTIHRLLKYDGATNKFAFNQNNLLDVDLVLVDEVSMVDLSLMSSLLDALPPHCALILVGDADQIPPVGAGQILESMIESERFTTVRLTEVHRQRQMSQIKINAHRINHGEVPHPTGLDHDGDFHYIPVQNAHHAKQVIAKLVKEIIPQRYGITDRSDIQVLTPLNRGSLGTLELNFDLQQMLSGNLSDRDRIEGFGQNFHLGDRVMVSKNDYKKEVFNGDIGFVRGIHHDAQFIEVQFDHRSVDFHFDELDRLTLAYAISIHKSQGSEYRAVIVVITEQHLPLAQRHLIYTAVTRGKEQVFLVAEPSALEVAVRSDSNNRRWQKLTELLMEPSQLQPSA